MNDNTYKLLESLAKKLGTTTEYLWNVLLKQAPVSATIDLLFFIVTVILSFVLYRFHLYFSKEREMPEWHRKQSIYEDRGEIVAIPMIVISIVCLILLLISFCSLENVINGFFNPEYWALNKLLKGVS